VYDAFGNLAADYGAPANAPGTQYVAVDAMGSTRLVMDGTAVERHDFEPYGAELTGGWRTAALGYESATVRQRFTGQERDDETTLDYFLARYYSGTQGRFGSPDPGNAGANPGDPQSWNGYAYVSGNPLTYTDPSGLQAGGGGDMAGGGGGDSGIAGVIATAFADALGFLIGGGGSHPNLSNIAWTPTPSAFDTNPALLSYTWFSPYSITSINLSFGEALSTGSLDDVALNSWQFHAVALGAQHAKKTVDYAGVGTAAVLSLPVVVPAASAAGDLALTGLNRALFGQFTNRIFWTGGTTAMLGAAARASEEGGLTLEMTAAGRTLTALGRFGDPLWSAASRMYAQGAVGPVTVFQGPVLRVVSTWGTVEYPQLIGKNPITYIGIGW
jgi:RHS repeat-associated protein